MKHGCGNAVLGKRYKLQRAISSVTTNAVAERFHCLSWKKYFWNHRTSTVGIVLDKIQLLFSHHCSLKPATVIFCSSRTVSDIVINSSLQTVLAKCKVHVKTWGHMSSVFELPIYQSIKAYVHTEALSAIGLVFSCSVVHGYLLFSLLDFSCRISWLHRFHIFLANFVSEIAALSGPSFFRTVSLQNIEWM